MSSPEKRDRRKHGSAERGEERRHKSKSGGREKSSGRERSTRGDGDGERSRRRERDAPAAGSGLRQSSSPGRASAAASGQALPALVADAPPPLGTAAPGVGSTSAPRQPDPLAAAFASRLLRLRDVQRSLAARRQALIGEIANWRMAMAEVSVARGRAEAETLADAEAVLHRLRAHEASKLARLRTAAEACAADVGAIDALDAAIRAFARGAGDEGGAAPGAAPSSQQPWALGTAAHWAGGATLGLVAGGGSAPPSEHAIALVRVYPELTAEADRLLSRGQQQQHPTVESLALDDFPHETTARAAAAAEAASLRALLDGKDELLSRLIAERAALEASRRDGAAECAALRRRAEAAEAAAAALQDEAAARLADERRELLHAADASNSQWAVLTDSLASELEAVTTRLATVQAASQHQQLLLQRGAATLEVPPHSGRHVAAAGAAAPRASAAARHTPVEAAVSAHSQHRQDRAGGGVHSPAQSLIPAPRGGAVDLRGGVAGARPTVSR